LITRPCYRSRVIFRAGDRAGSSGGGGDRLVQQRLAVQFREVVLLEIVVRQDGW
jgi:hypothetical protein